MHVLIILKVGKRGAGTAAARGEDPRGGHATFDGVGLSANGAAPATHVMCGWEVPPDRLDAFQARFRVLKTAADAQVYLYDIGTDPDTPDGLLRGLGLVPIATDPPGR